MVTQADQSAHPDMSMFEEARALASEGDIDGAVARYKLYTARRSFALLAAAKLLDESGRVREAIELYLEVVSRPEDNRAAWSRGVYELALLYRNDFDNKVDAALLISQLISETPDSEYAIMGKALLAELDPEGLGLVNVLEAAGEADGPIELERTPVEQLEALAMSRPQDPPDNVADLVERLRKTAD
jgi:tetratricopeptide (TPR) repeat protein